MANMYDEIYERLHKKWGYPDKSKGIDYISYDTDNTYKMAKSTTTIEIRQPRIKKVIFNDPATIVYWSDNTKTVVKCNEGDTFDKEKGLAMAITKKYLGNKGRYFNEIKKWTEN